MTQVLGRLFMGMTDDPFRALEAELRRHVLGGTVQAILVDVHAEATSEKTALGHFLDGRVSLVAGTHTHVPTADLRVLPGGTAYVTDVGMTGDYDSVIGMDKAASLHRWRSDVPGQKLQTATGPATFCAVLVETDDRTRQARCGPSRSASAAASSRPCRPGSDEHALEGQVAEQPLHRLGHAPVLVGRAARGIAAAPRR